MKPLAQLDVERVQDALVVHLEGEIDISNAAELGAALEAAATSDTLGIVLDLTHTSYIDSAGVHLLFRLGGRLTRRRQQLRIVVPADSPIKKVIKLTGVGWTVPQDDSVDEAVRGLRAEVRPVPGSETWNSDPNAEWW
jgi:anti-sigma B factor antagonist